MRRSVNTGIYKPRHPEKYNGDLTKLTFRSSWELHMNKFLDNNPNILEWSSEPFGVPYIKPTTGKVHKYYPDYWVKYKNKHGEIVVEIIEVKPDAQTKPPKRTGKNKKSQALEAVTYAINIAKWKACQEFCNKNGLKFKLLTEKQIFKN